MAQLLQHYRCGRTSRPYVSYPEYVQFTAWQLGDLSLFRHAPHMLRPRIYNDGQWRLQTSLGPGDTRSRRLHAVNGAAVLGELAERVRVATDQPVYKYIHVGIPHLPIAVDADCALLVGAPRVTRALYKAQARCAVRRVTALLDRLRDLGVYDSSLIVIASDHGLGFTPLKFANNRQLPAGVLSTLAARSMALLVVKPPDGRGPVRVSHAPTTITDIPATVLDSLGVAHTLPGEAALKVPENAVRSRAFAMYNWEHENWSQSYFDAIDLLEINGRLLDGHSWKLIGTIYPPDAGVDSRVRGLYDTHRSRTGVAYQWSMPQAFFHAPASARSFEVQVRSIAPAPQTVALFVDDRELVKMTLGEQSWVPLKLALPPGTGDGTWVRLQVDPPFRSRGDVRTLGVQTRGVRFAP